MAALDSFVKNIFPDTDCTDWKPSQFIPTIQEEIERIQLEIKSYLQSSEIDIDSILLESKELFDASKDLVSEMESCQKELEEETMAEILKSIEKHDEIKSELDKITFAINIVTDIQRSKKLLTDFDESRKVKSFSRGVQIISDLLQILVHPAEGYNQLILYQNAKASADVIWGRLLEDLHENFNKIIRWGNHPDGKKYLISVRIEINDVTIDLLEAMAECDLLEKKMAEFTDFYYDQVILPIMDQPCSIIRENEHKTSFTFFNNKQPKPSYNVIIENTKRALDFVYEKLNVNYKQGRKKIVELFCDKIHEEFRKDFMKNVLVETVPHNMSDMQAYESVIKDVEEFQKYLSSKYFPNETATILEYLEYINLIVSEKSSHYYLDTARTIMKKDLSISMSIGVESVPDPQTSGTTTAFEDGLSTLGKTIPKSLFYFPRCMVSKSAQELVDLIHAMMDEAAQCGDVLAENLYVTTRLVFELYDAVVPYHHENFLQTIPQYVALFHNNCMYLAHCLLTFGEKWLSQMEGHKMEYSVCFLDLVDKLRDLGYKHLTMHMLQQRKQILDNIRSSDLNSIAMKDELSENAEQAIRQCLRQLQLLKNVWIGVFPINIFTRLMATLVNMFVDEIIHRVCTVEDISAEMATQLSDIYTIVVKKAPSLFQNSPDIEQHVKSWVKLQELIFVLGGSLKDIENRWKEGTGPLAQHFRTEELRNLIKALFQNTQFRANLLAKIK